MATGSDDIDPKVVQQTASSLSTHKVLSASATTSLRYRHDGGIRTGAAKAIKLVDVAQGIQPDANLNGLNDSEIGRSCSFTARSTATNRSKQFHHPINPAISSSTTIIHHASTNRVNSGNNTLITSKSSCGSGARVMEIRLDDADGEESPRVNATAMRSTVEPSARGPRRSSTTSVRWRSGPTGSGAAGPRDSFGIVADLMTEKKRSPIGLRKGSRGEVCTTQSDENRGGDVNLVMAQRWPPLDQLPQSVNSSTMTQSDDRVSSPKASGGSSPGRIQALIRLFSKSRSTAFYSSAQQSPRDPLDWFDDNETSKVITTAVNTASNVTDDGADSSEGSSGLDPQGVVHCRGGAEYCKNEDLKAEALWPSSTENEGKIGKESADVPRSYPESRSPVLSSVAKINLPDRRIPETQYIDLCTNAAPHISDLTPC